MFFIVLTENEQKFGEICFVGMKGKDIKIKQNKMKCKNPKFLKNFWAKYLCGMSVDGTLRKGLNFHRKPRNWKEYESYTCRECGHTIRIKQGFIK